MTAEYCVLYEGRWVVPEWIDVSEAKAPDFNPNGYVPAQIEGTIRLFHRSHVRPVTPEQQEKS